MSEKDIARRSSYSVTFAGVDITKDLKPYFLSLTYTDNEEDEADDLQIKLQDRGGLWRTSWLGEIIHAAVKGYRYQYTPPSSGGGSGSGGGGGGGSSSNRYKVTAQSLKVHSRPGTQYFVYGVLNYGTVITVASISGGWANFTYEGKNAYCSAAYLQKVGSPSGSNSSGSGGNRSLPVTSSSSSEGDWHVGDAVIANGRPQYSAWGTGGNPGANVSNYHGTITHLYFSNGATYPICVGDLGWFAESQVIKAGASESSSGNVGLQIQAVIARQNWNGDGADEVLDCGLFELDSVVAQGPPSTVTIKATSLAFSKTIRQTEKSRVWENVTLQEIASTIADDNGMGLMFISQKDPKYSRKEQYRMSDIAFLQKLCHDSGCSLKATNNSIVIFDQAEFEGMPPVRTIGFGDKSYTSYKLSTKDEDTYTSCTVSYTTPSGTVISATAYVDDYNSEDEDNQCLRVSQMVSSTAEAMQLAHEMLRLHNKYAFIHTFTMPLDPSLCTGCTVKLDDTWGAFEGVYIIKQARHKIDSSSTTQISLRRSL